MYVTFKLTFFSLQTGVWSFSITNSGSFSTSVSATVTSRVSASSTSTFVTDVFWTQSNIAITGSSLSVVPQIIATLSLGKTTKSSV